MSAVAEKISPLEQLRRSLPDLPERLREAGRFIADHEFDATTRSMRDLAATAALAKIDVRQVARAAAALQRAPRIWVAGYRSCRSASSLLHYQLSLFRPDVRLVGAAGPEDIDFGSFRKGDAVVVIGFAPYSRASLLTAREARKAGCIHIAIADRVGAPIAEGADHFLAFDAALTPAFFHSLTGAISIVQALAAGVFELDGPEGAARLRRTEARLADLAQYVADEAST